jgi:Domain of Unknown Function (DUF1080)
LTIAAALVLVLGAGHTALAQEFKPLVKGGDVEQFRLIGIGPDTISIKDGAVRLSGKPNGYFATRDSYKNYVLRFEWKYERPAGLDPEAKFNGNSGLLLHIAEPHKVWPKCIEAQLMNADAGNTFAIGGAKFRGKKDAAAQKKAIKPVGEWNLQEVTCKDGTIVCTINGVEIARGDGASPDSGPIGLQSEGSVILFRNMVIKPLD